MTIEESWNYWRSSPSRCLDADWLLRHLPKPTLFRLMDHLLSPMKVHRRGLSVLSKLALVDRMMDARFLSTGRSYLKGSDFAQFNMPAIIRRTVRAWEKGLTNSQRKRLGLPARKVARNG
jgi:hypothetical protein